MGNVLTPQYIEYFIDLNDVNLQQKQINMKKYLFLILLLCSALLLQAENYPYRSDYLWLTQPDHADWIYKTGQKAKAEVGLYI